VKITEAQLREVIREAHEGGFFGEVTEDILRDDKEMSYLMRAFLSELKRKRVIRGKKARYKVICPKNKKYNASKKTCVRVGGAEKYKKKRGAKRAAIKRKRKMGKILKKRSKSMKIRKARGM
jgi:hypothetical protein